MRKRILSGIGFAILLVGLFWTWYSLAANYDYEALAGTYVFKGRAETCTLRLHVDGTFLEELDRDSSVQKAQGHWDRYGQAHVSFSGDFLTISGEELDAAGQAHGEFEKQFGLFPRLILAPLPNGPTFYKKSFR